METFLNALFLQDNVRQHIARRIIHFLKEAENEILPCPLRSSDLNLIEYVWNMIGNELSSLAQPPQIMSRL